MLLNVSPWETTVNTGDRMMLNVSPWETTVNTGDRMLLNASPWETTVNTGDRMLLNASPWETTVCSETPYRCRQVLNSCKRETYASANAVWLFPFVHQVDKLHKRALSFFEI
jgi:hypothetical protein